MSLYREVLYKNYSAAFAGGKRHDPSVQHAQYAATCPPLPRDDDCVVADLGCGHGEWLGWLAAQGFHNLVGVDGSEADLASARQHGPQCAQWVQADVTTFLQQNPRGFDLLHAKDVVEHMTKDEFIAFLQAARAALRPGGRLWIFTFNAQSPLSAATRYGDFTHESGFTPSSLAQCLRACGFVEVAVAGRHYCSRTLGGRVRAVLSRVVFGAARVLLKLRHGSGAGSSGVDQFTALPDVFAEGRVA